MTPPTLEVGRQSLFFNKASRSLGRRMDRHARFNDRSKLLTHNVGLIRYHRHSDPPLHLGNIETGKLGVLAYA